MLREVLNFGCNSLESVRACSIAISPVVIHQAGPVGAFGQKEVSLRLGRLPPPRPEPTNAQKILAMFVRGENRAHWLAVFQCICVVGTFLTACNQPVRPRPSEPDESKAAATVPSPAVQEVKERSYSTAESTPYDSGDIKVISVERKEEHQRFAYDLDISYPQIDKPRTSNQHRFNRYVRRVIESDVRAFKRYCVNNHRKRDGTKREMQYHLGIDYKVLFATPDVLSINLTIESFTGYLNSDWLSTPFNYDLKAGRPLALADIFKRRSKFLQVLATYCVDEFMRRGLNCGCERVLNQLKTTTQVGISLATAYR